ncbi:hypothetical protein D3C86_2193450 [compost metagenome]
MAVNLEVILSIVLMVRRRFKYRSEVYGIDAQLSYMIQVIDDALQVAAEKVFRRRFAAPFFRIFWID